jgi:hypothetical protein
MAIETGADLRGDVREQERLVHGILYSCKLSKRTRERMPSIWGAPPVPVTVWHPQLVP